MSEEKALNQCSGVIHSEPVQRYGDSDDEPMVYEKHKDYATSVRQSRDNLIAEGVDPGSIIFQSDLRNRILRREDESRADFAKRYVETVNAMIGRGITILNDQCTTQVVASRFRTADGRVFDLGPESWA
uniref:Polyribonucleotide nucleotidyltransferase n=1 Tax=Talaromyces marneffei PM1 TaxID=1077442 RepID=A0A093ULC6_TALMA